MKIWTIPVGAFAVDCYVLQGTGQQAIVVDPGDEAEAIAQRIHDKHLDITAYLLTHGHMDHISALAELQQQHPAPIHMHPADAEWAFTTMNQMPPYGVPQMPPNGILPDLRASQQHQVAGLTYDVIETPGHSPGSVCFYFAEQQILFSGDTLFAGSIGRTDLPGGNAQHMQQSLQLLQQLPPATQVYPGHGNRTSLKREQQYNPYLQTL